MANLEVNLIGDSRSLERAFDRSGRAATKFQRQMKSTSRGIQGAFAAVGVTLGVGVLIDGLAGAVKAASNLNESMSKTDAVFGKSADAVTEWSKTTSLAFGVSQRSALETASSFGALFAPLGIVGDTAADQSRKLVELGADLAAFYNTDVQSALDAIRSGLVGESEPLRRYGAQLSEIRVTEEALSETHKKHAADLTTQEKVLARIALIYRDTAVAQGNFGDTSGALAGQQKILGAQLDDFQVKLGQVLLPEITKVVTKMNRWLSSTENQDELLGKFTTTVDVTTTAIYNLAAAVQTAANAYQNLNEQVSKAKGFLDKIGLGINRQTLFRVVPGTQQIFEGIGALTAERGDRAKRHATLTGGTALSPDTQEVARAARAAVKNAKAAVQKIVDEETAKKPRGITAAQRNAWFDAMIGRQLGRVQDVTSLRGQIARYGEIANLIRQRLAVTKDVTRRLNLEDQLTDVLRTRRGVRSALTDQMEQRADEAKAAAKKAREAAAEAKRLKTERKFGWLDFALGRAEAADDPGRQRRVLKRIEAALLDQIRAEGRTLELTERLWAVRDQIRDLNKKKEGMAISQFRHVSPGKLAAMLGLAGDPRAKSLLARYGAGGSLSTGGGAFSRGGMVVSGGIHLHGVQNVRQLENEIAKTQRARPQVRRGAR